MSSLANQQQNTSFGGLLQIPGGVTSTIKTVQDGNGNSTALRMSTTQVEGLTGVSDASLIYYTPAGAGAVETTVQAVLREHVSVKDFGAVGDGATNDTTAIQAAYTYAHSVNKTLYIPEGRYLVSGLVFDKSINVIGENEQVFFLAGQDNITVVKFNHIDRRPGYAYTCNIANFSVETNGKVNCIGLHSRAGIGCIYDNISVNGGVQGFLMEGDQYCTYINIRVRGNTIGFRLKSLGIDVGGGNNNVFISPNASINQVAYLIGESSPAYPLSTITLINAVGLGSSHCTYAVLGFQGCTLTNISPEACTGSGTATYDGESIPASLGYFYKSTCTIRDSVIANNVLDMQAVNSIISFDNYAGARCTVTKDSASTVNFINGFQPGNGSTIQATSIDNIYVGNGRNLAARTLVETQDSKTIPNLVLDPQGLLFNAVATLGVVAAYTQHPLLGLCGSFVGGANGSGVSAFTTSATSNRWLLGINVVTSADCNVVLNIPGQTASNYSMVAGVPRRLYVFGGATSASAIGYFSLLMGDTSGATIYFNKAQMFSDANVVDFQDAVSRTVKSHLYNNNRSAGVYDVYTSAPSFGTWAVGNIIYALTPTAGGNLGWICTTAGSPGTWNTFGAISA